MQRAEGNAFHLVRWIGFSEDDGEAPAGAVPN